ncbi:SIMPL domain-containing protein [Blastococcus sp. PRF04-17]|uniref:SIMPL domain-containing protein n=1 Tax=Blastococcus sp. PRF04-17 TaxID=2933797 RepID=UPI001FF36272|nr:SIMPL domain-containing protein [Blastococcus sp. PRF04-17]UOY03564.1 SIMPL domain-containing protein [Blastococcus sp. PRF04-17]
MNSSPQQARRPQVVVRGEAAVLVDPEVADVGVTVRSRARDRQTALERCTARQAEVSAVVAGLGAAVERSETTAVSVHVEVRDRRAPGEPVASVHTQLTLGRIDVVGELVVALGRLDDVAVSGPGWRLRPDSPALERARLDAVRDAVRRARQYAAAFGAELTELLEVDDTGHSGYGLRVAGAMDSMARFESSDLQLDLTPARQEVHGAVEVRFAMSEPDREVFGA